MAKGKGKGKAAPVVDEDVFEELEEVDEDETDEAPAPKKSKGKAAATAKESNGFDTNWLSSHVAESTGVTLDSRQIRILLRKMAAAGELDRAVGEDKGRYTFKGANDATVKAMVKKVKSGEHITRRAAADDDEDEAKPVKKKAKVAEVEEAPAKKTKIKKGATEAPAKATPAKKRRAAPED